MASSGDGKKDLPPPEDQPKEVTEDKEAGERRSTLAGLRSRISRVIQRITSGTGSSEPLPPGQETAQASNVEENVREATMTLDPLVAFRPVFGRHATLPSVTEAEIPERKKADSPPDSLKGLIGSKRTSERRSDSSEEGAAPVKKRKPVTKESGKPKESGKRESYFGDLSSNEGGPDPQDTVRFRTRPSTVDSGKAKEELEEEATSEPLIRFRSNPSAQISRPMPFFGEFGDGESRAAEEPASQAQQPSGSAAVEALEDVPSVSRGATQELAEMVIRKDPKKEPEDRKEE